jgi:hypothetical protein
MPSDESNATDSQFKGLLSHYSVGGADPSSEQSTKTSGDKKFEASQHVHEVATHMNNLAPALLSFINILTNNQEKKRVKKAAAKDIAKTVIPFVQLASKALTAAATKVAPLRGSQYVHNRATKKRAVEVVDSSSSKLPAVQMMDDFVARFDEESRKSPPEALANTEARATTRPTTRSLMNLPMSIVPPTPRAGPGKLYSRSEFCEIVTKYPKNSGERKLMIDNIIKANPPLVRNAETALYNLLCGYENGEPIVCEEWRRPGRQKYAEEEDMDKLAESLKIRKGEEFGRKEMNEYLKKMKSDKMIKAGYAPTTVQEKLPSSTLDNYLSLLASRPGMHLNKSAIAKTDSRYTNEKEQFVQQCCHVAHDNCWNAFPSS